MSRPIDSDGVNHGLNRDVGKYDDHGYIRCNNCGFICHIDRDAHSQRGDKTGDGITHPEVVEYDASTVTYDGTDDNWENGTVSYDGYRSDFTITAGCPFCGKLIWQE